MGTSTVKEWKLDEVIGIEIVTKQKITLAVCNDNTYGWGYNNE